MFMVKMVKQQSDETTDSPIYVCFYKLIYVAVAGMMSTVLISVITVRVVNL